MRNVNKNRKMSSAHNYIFLIMRTVRAIINFAIMSRVQNGWVRNPYYHKGYVHTPTCGGKVVVHVADARRPPYPALRWAPYLEQMREEQRAK